MIGLDEYDVKLINELNKKGYTGNKTTEIKDKSYISKDELINCIEDLYGELQVSEETITELNNKIEEVYKEKQGCWLDSYIAVKMKYEELEEKLETIKSTLAEDDYDRLNERGVEI